MYTVSLSRTTPFSVTHLVVVVVDDSNDVIFSILNLPTASPPVACPTIYETFIIRDYCETIVVCAEYFGVTIYAVRYC